MLKIVLGVPGSGKTTYLAKCAKEAMKKGITVYSNVYIEGAYIIDSHDDVGKYLIENALLLIDEGGSEYDNRAWKSMKRRIIRWYKMHRHYSCDVIISSQDYDIDVKLRSLASEIVVVSKSFIPYFVKLKSIKSSIGLIINDEGYATDITKTFKYKFLGVRYFFAPIYWKYFNSYYQDNLFKKEFKKWTNEDESSYCLDFTDPKTFALYEK